jgi:hypothetical protein
MSTAYLLINRKNEKVKDNFNELVELEMAKLKESLLRFNDENELCREDEIKENVRYFLNNLGSDIVIVEEVPICQVSSNTVYWEDTAYYNNLDKFKEFYEVNKDKYFIADETRKEFSLDEFLNNISLNDCCNSLTKSDGPSILKNGGKSRIVASIECDDSLYEI